MYQPFVHLLELSAENITHIQDSRELNELLEEVGFPEQWASEITGACVIRENEDCAAVWVSESAAPYENVAIYHPLPFYLNGMLSHAMAFYTESCWLVDNPHYNTEVKS